MDAKQLFQECKLDEAIQQVTDEIRKSPTDAALRTFLFDLLCFQGNVDRAVKQLDLIASASADSQTAAMAFRGVLFAEESRRKVFAGEEKPKAFIDPPEYVERHLEAVGLLAKGDHAAANQILSDAETARSEITGKRGDETFGDIRDCDDVIGPMVEFIFQSDYFWVPLEQVMQLSIEPPTQSRDLIWAPAKITLIDGMPRGGYVSALYIGTHESADAEVRMGRKTEWVEQDNAPVRGIGQRMMLVGEDAFGLLELGNVRTDAELALPQEDEDETDSDA